MQKKSSRLFGTAGISINNIDAILVTHEHIDHIKSLGTISSKYDIPVYANSRTWEAIPNNETHKIHSLNKKTFTMLENFEIGDLKIFPFDIPHDATDPCGFNIYNGTQKIRFPSQQNENGALIAKLDLRKSINLMINKDIINKIELIGYSNLTPLKTPENYISVTINEVYDFYYTYNTLINYTLLSYRPSERFGCCGRYIDCSDNNKCTHPNKLYARACQYRENLENGLIFYGVNKNI